MRLSFTILLILAAAVSGAVIGRADGDEVASSANSTTATRVMVTLIPESPFLKVITTAEVMTIFPKPTPAP
ncbi:hypothetical protein Moror_16865 [Moniliophthora roreri MCA 2997]|uniref:Secreted protein n=2 Tax=Moniliophthora roreri TaxID=221103 RepID=V2YDG2_MONRO|nr:hypothetical protein Moror_16865 [Moniliophthora roreri MCA 2997]KAI3620830.1 hypothetical protein WG66_006255 [Moniliophthora roreri]